MRIVVITTNGNTGEDGRIAQEVEKMGYEFKLCNLSDLEYEIREGKLVIDGFSIGPDDIVIPRGIFSSLHMICSLISSLRKKGTRVFDNNLLTHKYSINKLSDLIKLAGAGIPTPNALYLRSFDKYKKATEKLGYPLIIKLTRTGKGVGIYKIESQENLNNFISLAKEEETEASRYLLQEFVDYKYDLRVLIIGDRVFCMRRIPSEGEFRANFSLGGSVEVFDLGAEDESLAREAMRAIDLEVAGVDLLITKDDRRYILEVNHTPGMLGMEEATGENITKYYLEYAIEHAK